MRQCLKIPKLHTKNRNLAKMYHVGSLGSKQSSIIAHNGAKMHHFIFKITLLNLPVLKQSWARVYANKIGTERHQNQQSLLKHVSAL